MRGLNTPTRVAVIGGGHLGRIHAKLLSSQTDCEVVCVADPSEASRALVEKDLGLKTESDYKTLENRIDAAVVAAPTFLHHEIGVWCLQRGIHCFLEKPIAATTNESHHLVSLAHDNQCILQVGHVERFNPAWKSACENLSRDSIRYIEAAREGTYTGRSTDIGIVMDLMIHDIDLVLSVVKSPVETVQAFGWNVLGRHEDFAVAQVRFRNGTIAQLRASRIAESPKRAMQIYCDDGITQIDFGAGTVSRTEPTEDVANGLRFADDLPAEQRAKVKDALFSDWLCKTELKPQAANAIGIEQSEFIQAIRTGTPVTVDGHDGAAALGVATQIVRAIDLQAPARAIIPAADRFAA